MYVLNIEIKKNMFLGSANATDLRGFYIYVHEKGQFWPGLEMERIGQPNPLYIPVMTELHSSFTVRKKINLATDSTPCVKYSTYSYTSCMKNYVSKTAGCHLDWVDNTTLTNSNQAICVTLDQVLRYQSILTNIRWNLIVVQASKQFTTAKKNFSKLSWTERVQISGCKAKCSYMQYGFYKVSPSIKSYD